VLRQTRYQRLRRVKRLPSPPDNPPPINPGHT
jgi:hypothetical protein